MIEIVGIFYFIGVVGYYAIQSCRNKVFKNKSKFESIKNNKDIYYDLYGNEYYKDKKVIKTGMYDIKNGITHDVIIDYKGNILMDYTSEKINNFFIYINNTIKNATNNNDKFFYIDGMSFFKNEIAKYKELYIKYSGLYETDTGKRYVLDKKYKTKTYYKESNCKTKIMAYLIDSDSRITLTDDEFISYGGNIHNYYDNAMLPIGSIIVMKGEQKYERN